ncbi:hypothetical protein DITRI_Ditri10aG0165800 [Diplodiscus trichospermus]
MGSDSQFQIPIIEFSTGLSKEMGQGTDGWQSLCQNVRDACENFGCFEVVYDKISSHLREQTFSSIRQLFDLPLETKKKYINPKPYHGYYEPGRLSSFYESIGLEDASDCNSAKSFAQLMWPDDHDHDQDHFCQTILTIMKELEELSHTIGSVIIDSYGLGGKPESFMTHYLLLRVMKYLPPLSGEYTNALMPHTDKFSSVLLCEDQIAGLEIQTKEGHWLKAWSKGRMHAARHGVMMSGDKERYSFGAFEVPVEGTIIKAPKEMVDEEHPQVFKDFDYTDFLNYSYSEEVRQLDSGMKVFNYAALPRN